jgi:hypothetical protein
MDQFTMQEFLNTFLQQNAAQMQLLQTELQGIRNDMNINKSDNSEQVEMLKENKSKTDSTLSEFKVQLDTSAAEEEEKKKGNNEKFQLIEEIDANFSTIESIQCVTAESDLKDDILVVKAADKFADIARYLDSFSPSPK